MDLDTLIEQTKEKVGAIISKPKMAEKLLAKPPFRYVRTIYEYKIASIYKLT